MFRIVREPDLAQVLIIVTGETSRSEIADGIADCFSDQPDRFPDVIWDFADADLSRLTTDDVMDLVSISESYRDRRPLQGKTAIVAPTDLVYGLGRMYKTLSNRGDSGRIRVVRCREDALSWIGSGDKAL